MKPLAQISGLLLPIPPSKIDVKCLLQKPFSLKKTCNDLIDRFFETYGRFRHNKRLVS
jgi:hypothetical protein